MGSATFEEEDQSLRSKTALSLLKTHLPAYFLTGGLAGVVSATGAVTFDRFVSSPTHTWVPRSQILAAIRHGAIGGALRFTGFSGARLAIQAALDRASINAADADWKLVLHTGVSGALGGVFEAACLSIASGNGSRMLVPVVKQGSRVGICFTVFSTLSNYSPLHKPYHPPPFTTALLYGSAAGIFGMVALHPFESKVPLMEMLAKGGGGTIGRGAVAVGLVISVQNMLVREVLRKR